MSLKVHDPLVEGRLASIDDAMKQRQAIHSSVVIGRTGNFACRYPTDHRLLPPDRGHTQGGSRRGELSYIDYRGVLKKKAEAPSAGRKRSASTCWSMADSDATT